MKSGRILSIQSTSLLVGYLFEHKMARSKFLLKGHTSVSGNFMVILLLFCIVFVLKSYSCLQFLFCRSLAVHIVDYSKRSLNMCSMD